MGANRKITLSAVVITAIIGSVLTISAMLTTAYGGSENNGGLLEGTTTNFPPRIKDQDMAAWGKASLMQRFFSVPKHLNQNWSGNVTIDAEQAKTLVESSISNFKVGTITALRTGWLVPIEDTQGVVTSIHVTTVSASTAEQAKDIVKESLKNGWQAGESQLMGIIYNIPLLDSKSATIGYVRVDGMSGEIIRSSSTILTVTIEEAKTIVNDAIKEFEVGEVKERRALWVVDINYEDNPVMTVLFGKLNTPTSEDALNALQDSLAKGWSAGEPTQSRFAYNVPIIDANGNTIGNISVDGTNGDIITGFPLRCR